MKHPMFYILPLMFALLTWVSMAEIPTQAPTQAALLDTLAHEYSDEYQRLDVPPLAISWRENLKADLGNAPMLSDQGTFFTNMQTRLADIKTRELDACQYINHQILSYETDLNLARLPLAQAYAENPATTLSDQGYSSFARGKDWYEWYLKKWLTTDITPREIMAFGEDELITARADLAKLESDIIQSGTASSLANFIETKSTSFPDEATTLAMFKARKSLIEHNLPKLFMPYIIDPVGIKPNTNPAMARAPGYYNPPDFFYGWDGTSYRAQDTDFLFLHEALPGHHFQFQVAEKYKACTFIMPPVFYQTFAEGWGAYVETLGSKLGVYDSFETRLGAIDWNLIRSARTYLDVAINDQGWSDAQANAYWQDNLPPHLYRLAAREIKRMRDWPAQVITYKIGADAILKLRGQEKERVGENFDIRTFHDKLLRLGPVPLGILKDVFAHIPDP